MVERSTIDGIAIEQIPIEDIKASYQLIENDLKQIRKKSFI